MKHLLSILILLSSLSSINANESSMNFLCSNPNHTDTFFFSTSESKVTLETDGIIKSGGVFQRTENYYSFIFYDEGKIINFRANRFTKVFSLYINNEKDISWPDTAKCELIERAL